MFVFALAHLLFFLSLDFVGNDLIASLKIEGKSYVVNETKC